MTSTYTLSTPLLHQRNVFPQPITALSFDPVADTLWAGTSTGSIVAYHSPTGMRGVCFPIDAAGMGVRKISAGETYVRAVGIAGEGIGQWSKGGVNKWHYRANAPITNVTTFSSSAGSSQSLCAATTTPELLFLNAITGAVTRRIQAPSIVDHLSYSHTLLLSGSVDGYLRTYDPRSGLRRDTGNAEASVQAHIAGIQGLQTSGNYVYTIGMGIRRSRPFPDPLVRVYDLRQMRSLSHIPFSEGPAFINVLPRKPSSVVITSHEGLVHIADVTSTAETEVHQLGVSYLGSAAVSPTGAYMAFGDSDGTIHVMSASQSEDDHLPFNGYEGQPIEWANVPAPLPEIEWTDNTPLNSVGLPYYKSLLLSSWSPHFVPSNGTPLFPRPQKIPPGIIASMKRSGTVNYAPLPKELRGRRNVVVGPKRVQARFRSGRMQRHESENDALNPESIIPKPYRKLEIEYSKFGVEDFDFGFYNKTSYSGLETHILNCYTNSVLQAMHYLHPVRELVKAHITTDCPREHCLMCELGFVVRNLEDAKGTNCHAGNFCKALGILASANNATDLVEYGRETPGMDYSLMIQSFNRFMVERLVGEWNGHPYNPRLRKSADHRAPALPPITQLFGINVKTVNVCSSCKTPRSKDVTTHVVDLIYPRTQSGGIDFAGVLRQSLIREVSHKATCRSCSKTVPFTSRRMFTAKNLPPILAVNACVGGSEDHHRMWMDGRKSTFLSPRIEIKGEIGTEAGSDDPPDTAVYEIRGLVVQVVTEKQSHLVAIIKVPEAENSGNSPWFVFNDFGVRNVKEAEALSFPEVWKVPAIVYLQRVDIQDDLNPSVLPNEVDERILSRDTNIAIHRDPGLIKHQLLRENEMPGPGTVVAIDAEFVLMQQEETEFRSDGTKKMLRPARLSLARVSVLRGGGPKQGVPFIDDHIHTSETIVDNLTEFSGIKFGDLDPHLSRHTLTPLKLVYKKLRLLVDRGCIFIGHGLSKDFRMINIFVPPDQVLDTVDIYFLQSRQRRLSLRFLTWFVLEEQIQQETHDSIEDARAALDLYHAFLKFESEGVWDQKLEELYREGKQYNFKPPAPPPSSKPAPTPTAQTMTTPMSSPPHPPPPQFIPSGALAPAAPPFGLIHPVANIGFHHPAFGMIQAPFPFGPSPGPTLPSMQPAFVPGSAPQTPPVHYEQQTWRNRR